MDRRIDLTQNHDFSTVRWGLRISPSGRTNPLSEDADWGANYRDGCLFPTGNKEEILRFHWLRSICGGIHCDRCGKPLRIPWRRFYGLCETCDEQLEFDIRGRVPWEKLLSSKNPNVNLDPFIAGIKTTL